MPIEVVGGQTAGITLDVPTGAYTVEEIASDDTGVTSGTIEVNGKTYQVKAEGNSDIVISKNGNKTASFTNSLTEEKDITVTKTWKDNDSDKRPDKGDFTVTLTAAMTASIRFQETIGRETVIPERDDQSAGIQRWNPHYIYRGGDPAERLYAGVFKHNEHYSGRWRDRSRTDNTLKTGSLTVSRR